MAKPKSDTRTWTSAQVVAHNMARARQLRGLTQAEVAERLSKFSESRWSQATVAQAEGSVSGPRVRQFTANDVVWNLKRVLDPKTGSSVLGLFKSFLLEEFDAGEKLAGKVPRVFGRITSASRSTLSRIGTV